MVPISAEYAYFGKSSHDKQCLSGIITFVYHILHVCNHWHCMQTLTEDAKSYMRREGKKSFWSGN